MYISSFSISGYRSLQAVDIKRMLPICIFHGLNNSGKSNILSAIETIFRRKRVVEETTIAGVTTHEREGSFWRGRISGFRDNFYRDEKKDIKFSISVTLDDKELSFLTEILTQLDEFLARPGHNKVLSLSGKITYVDDDTADMVLEKAVFNKSRVVFERDAAGKTTFFPKAKTHSIDQRVAHFDRLMNILAGSFVVIPSDRYVTGNQAASQPDLKLPFTPSTFKRWLFELYLNRSGHSPFEEIKAMFKSNPFAIGEIGFSREADQIEIMVKDAHVRLPIDRLGSGHQQILYIVASLVVNKGKMIGIEELEINLSPKLQTVLFEKLKRHILVAKDLASQLIITSHSDYFRGRQDVRCYSVEHTGSHTVVNPWTRAHRTGFFLPGT
jgi:predicted ATPase